MAHPNEAIARKFFAAADAGDFDTIMGIWSDDIVFHMPGNNVMSGTFKGKAEAGAMFARGGHIKLRRELHDSMATDTHAVNLTRVSGDRDGKTYSWNGVAVMEIRDGKVVEQWLIADDQAAVDALFA